MPPASPPSPIRYAPGPLHHPALSRQNCRGLFFKGSFACGSAPSAVSMLPPSSPAPAHPQCLCANRPQGEDPLGFADDATFTAAERCEWTVKLQWDLSIEHGRRRRHQVWISRPSILPGPAPPSSFPIAFQFSPEPDPQGGSTCRRGVGARTGTPSFAGTAYPSTHGDGVGLSRPFAAYVVSDRARSWNRPALGRCSPGLAATSVLPADTRGRGEPQAGRGTADGLGRCHWRRATASGHSPPSLAASRRSSAV